MSNNNLIENALKKLHVIMGIEFWYKDRSALRTGTDLGPIDDLFAMGYLREEEVSPNAWRLTFVAAISQYQEIEDRLYARVKE